MTAKKLTPQEALPQIRESLSAGRPCHLTVTGGSMLPFLRPGLDAVILMSFSGMVRPGDILFYLRAPDTPVLHRVQKRLPDGTLLLCGDAQTALEPVSPAQVLASVSHIHRSERLIDCRNPLWQFLSRFWMLLRPCRPALFRIKRFFYIANAKKRS